MTDKIRIFVDMDGTLARFHDENLYLERMFEKGFFRDLKPFSNAVDAIKRIIDNHPNVDVYVLSATITTPYCLAEKNAWLDKGTYYHGEYKTPGEVSEAVSSIDTNGMQYILDCCEKYSTKIRNLKAYITSLVFSLAESCQTTIRSQIEENSNSSFDVYKLDQWALEQYATGI